MTISSSSITLGLLPAPDDQCGIHHPSRGKSLTVVVDQVMLTAPRRLLVGSRVGRALVPPRDLLEQGCAVPDKVPYPPGLVLGVEVKSVLVAPPRFQTYELILNTCIIFFFESNQNIFL